MGFPETTGETLYALVMKDEEYKKKAEKVAKQEAGARYKAAGKDTDLNDTAIMDELFKSENDTVRNKIIGAIDRKTFQGALGRCIPKVKQQDINELLVYKAFPETYFHPDIAEALSKGGKGPLTNPELLADRIIETGAYLFGYKEPRFLSTALMVGMSHSVSRNMYGGGKYTEETVAYTLLTFSFFGAKKLGISDPDWFFYWKVFGSLMGLSLDYLPDNYDRAKALMGSIHKKSCFPAKPLTVHQETLLSAFLTAFESDTPPLLDRYIVDKVKPTFSDWCSSRMAEYLKSKGLVGKNKKESKT